MDTCPKTGCGADVPRNEVNCPVCRTFVGYPNVRTAQAELANLAARYAVVQDAIGSEARKQKVASFEHAVQGSKAVVNTDGRYLESFLFNGNMQYATYASLVKADARLSAEEKFDNHRSSVDGKLFGSGSSEIRFAALSLDGVGLQSYGPYSVTLKGVAIDDRASLLEENAFLFIERHNITPATDVPMGYRAEWQNRHLLATVKLAGKIDDSTNEVEYAQILLTSTGDRATDEFLEVHIYGPFNRMAIEKVKGAAEPKATLEKARKSAIKDLLNSIGAEWEDE